MPKIRIVVVRYGVARETTSRTSPVSSAAGHIDWSSRGGPGSTTITGPSVGTTSPGAVPAGSSGVAPSGNHRLLPVRLAQGLRVETEPAREAGQDLRDSLLHLLVENELPPGEVRHRLGGEVVGRGAEPAAGDDQAHAQIGQEPERGLQVGLAVAHADDVGDLHSELPQPLGDPGAVAVGDPAREHLRARDDHAASNRAVAYGHFFPRYGTDVIPPASIAKLAGFLECTRWGLPASTTVAAPPEIRSRR